MVGFSLNPIWYTILWWTIPLSNLCVISLSGGRVSWYYRFMYCICYSTAVGTYSPLLPAPLLREVVTFFVEDGDEIMEYLQKLWECMFYQNYLWSLLVIADLIIVPKCVNATPTFFFSVEHFKSDFLGGKYSHAIPIIKQIYTFVLLLLHLINHTNSEVSYTLL